MLVLNLEQAKLDLPNNCCCVRAAIGGFSERRTLRKAPTHALGCYVNGNRPGSHFFSALARIVHTSH
jgi:hypothetical protein